MSVYPFNKTPFVNAAPTLYAPNMLPAEASGLIQNRNNMDFFLTHIGEEPLQVICPNCKAAIMTETNQKVGLLTYLMSCCICLVG